MSDGREIMVVNFAHPLTAPQRAEIERLVGSPLSAVVECMPHVDPADDFEAVAAHVVDGAGLSAEQWQTMPVLVLVPGLAPLAVAVVAEIHGRAGHFPSIVRLRPVEGSTPTRYEVAEIVNLQALRDRARFRRVDVDA